MTIKQQGGIFGRNPTFNDLTVEGSVNIDGGAIDNTVIGGSTPAAISGTTGTFSGNLIVDTDTLFVDTSNDRIGVGTVSPSGDGESIHIHGATANSTLHLTNSTTGSGAGDGTYLTTSGNDFLLRNREAGSTIIYSNNTPRMTIDSGGDVTINTGNVVMANGKGIDFSATSGTGTSELFDDYEEGEWTGVFSDGTNNATMNSSYTKGRYVKVGSQVTISCYLINTSIGSMSGDVRITGLPFTSANANEYAAGCGLGFAASLVITAGHNVSAYVGKNLNYILLRSWDAAGGTSALQASELSDGGQVAFSLTYFAA